MKKAIVLLIVMVCLAAGIWGIFMLRGSAGKAGDHVENDNGNTGVAADVTESGTTTEEQTADSQETTEVTEEEKPSLVDETLAGMTLHEKVCQMMFVTPEELTGEDGVTVAGDATRQALENYPVGGIVYFAKNLESQDQVKEMIDNSQKYSSIGLFVATDEEGGVVNRLMDTVGTTYIGSMYYYKDDGDETAYENAYTIANDMSALGFNLDFAPVADVWSNPDNTVIGERAYSDDYAQAAELVGNAVKGFNDGGVMCTLKHFPGHGDTAEDSHYSSAYVHRTKEEIMADEMQPFRSGIEAGAEFVMVGHLIVPDIDEVPATLSYKIATGILRDELKFEGVAITDSFEMESIADNYSVDDAVVMSVKAGMDMILQPKDMASAVNSIEQAVADGELSEDRIDESVRRILTLKESRGLLK
ncbi:MULTISPECIES: glycoside hydrolase family 3 protein [Coprococcus]|jgi:beta-N-acetylhexosaminidase|uniref:glycoside hydrolase family 3 protein n=1 Tax=Coprococcus TaxID=33042 RepID=UPI000E417E5B|nr:MULTISPECIES: glycoside hydrolase family 3 protein [Coprococcus]RGD40186.1 glycoside hydrolase family 3 [Coprococcus sp. AM14-16]RGI37440.1 glycoside hydrolase family 3 [Coprococcus sp. OM06-34AC]RGI43828.1 glycoside hydrolase family 3 [Coprococcus sp. OM06-25]RHU49945.1 glycoside hydrolase family 3 [Coprococcus sp. TF11-13]RJV46432.1 glycoside hydrolase family 3 [Coprococcus sp. AF19-8AC]